MNASLFWNASIKDMKRGYIFNAQEDSFYCLLCGAIYEQGIVFPSGDTLLTAERAMAYHIKTQHPPLFEYFLSLGRNYTGLSAGQEALARLFYAGYSDKEIVAKTGTGSVSTVRNQRFAIREKYKQAKVLAALTELMEEKLAEPRPKAKTNDGEKLVDFHPTAKNIDERYAITQKEKEEILSRYFGKDNQVLITTFPRQEKKKIIIMQKIMEDFETNKKYSEKEVNAIIKRYNEDFVSVRRYLIMYGFMDRDRDGGNYWVKLASQ